MITLKDVANFIEDGINANLNYPNVVARVWAGVGRRLKPVRQGNTVTYFLTGSLRRPGSSDSALRIEAGTNNLLLELEVPQKPPKTEAMQTEPELRETIDDQYVFPQLVAEAVNTFFQSVRTVTMVDGAGKTFSLGFTTGLNITGDVGRRSPSGDYAMIEVYIEMAYVEGGVNSRVSTLAIDSEDNFIPYQTKTVTRAPTEQPDVYAGGTAKQTLDTSATFGISFTAPVTEDFDAFDGFLQDGKLNVAHFIIESDGTPHYHFMKVHSVQRDAANVQNLPCSISSSWTSPTAIRSGASSSLPQTTTRSRSRRPRRGFWHGAAGSSPSRRGRASLSRSRRGILPMTTRKTCTSSMSSRMSP